MNKLYFPDCYKGMFYVDCLKNHIFDICSSETALANFIQKQYDSDLLILYRVTIPEEFSKINATLHFNDGIWDYVEFETEQDKMFFLLKWA